MERATRDLWRTWRTRRTSAAFEALVRPEVPYALDLARRMGAGAQDAEDVVQESLLLLARERSDEPVRVGLRAWICRRVVLRVRMRARAGSRRRRYERSAPPRTPEPEGTAVLEMRDEVETALGHLEEEDRRTVLLRYLHDLDYREIAYVLGITENACRIRVHRAIQRLRATLGTKAPALLAAIALPAATAEGSLVAGALASSGKGTMAFLSALAAKTGGKVAGAAALAAATVATVVVLTPEPERTAPPLPPAPALVVRAETPPPAPFVPPPAVQPAPPPAVPPPPAPPRGLDLLRAWLDGDASDVDRFWDPDALRDLFPHPAADAITVAQDGEVDLWFVAGDAPRIAFGPGRFRLDQRRWPHRILEGRLDALEITGAGRGETTLVVGEAEDLFHVAGVVGSLRLSDVTVEGTALDVRGEAAVLCERVRFRGWRARVGYGAPAGLSGRALLVFEDCEFLGGYRGPAGGHALAPRGDCVALFRNCRFVDLVSALPGMFGEKPGPRSLVHVRKGEFVNSPLVDGGVAFPLRVREATVRYESPRFISESRLEHWGERHAALLEGVEILPGVPRCTLADLRAAARGCRLRGGERLVGIHALVWEGAPAAHFAVHVAGPRGERETRLLRRERDGFAEITGHDFALPEWPRGLEHDRGSDVTRAQRAASEELDGSLEIAMAYGDVVGGPEGRDVAVVTLADLFGRPRYRIDAATGEVSRR